MITRKKNVKKPIETKNQYQRDIGAEFHQISREKS